VLFVDLDLVDVLDRAGVEQFGMGGLAGAAREEGAALIPSPLYSGERDRVRGFSVRAEPTPHPRPLPRV